VLENFLPIKTDILFLDKYLKAQRPLHHSSIVKAFRVLTSDSAWMLSMQQIYSLWRKGWTPTQLTQSAENTWSKQNTLKKSTSTFQVLKKLSNIENANDELHHRANPTRGHALFSDDNHPYPPSPHIRHRGKLIPCFECCTSRFLPNFVFFWP